MSTKDIEGQAEILAAALRSTIAKHDKVSVNKAPPFQIIKGRKPITLYGATLNAPSFLKDLLQSLYYAVKGSIRAFLRRRRAITAYKSETPKNAY